MTNPVPPVAEMTLRQYYAAQAMAGWLASLGPRSEFPGNDDCAWLAADFFDMADAMLEEEGLK